MRFAARMLYYHSQRSCCLVNFIAIKFQITTLFLYDSGCRILVLGLKVSRRTEPVPLSVLCFLRVLLP